MNQKPKCFGQVYQDTITDYDCVICEWVWLCLDEEDKNEDSVD